MIPSRRSRPPKRPAQQSLVVQALLCAKRTFKLLFRKKLHLRRERIGAVATLPDGRAFTVFRESIRDDAGPSRTALAVWFHLRGIPAGSRVRRFLFERLCLANTLLFAGFDGYRVKLWMVDPKTADYAGLYLWRSDEEAEVYGRYIVGVLSPLSRRGSVGYRVLPLTAFEDCLASQGSLTERADDNGPQVHKPGCSSGSSLPRRIHESKVEATYRATQSSGKRAAIGRLEATGEMLNGSRETIGQETLTDEGAQTMKGKHDDGNQCQSEQEWS
jgi:hypothetical protein